MLQRHFWKLRVCSPTNVLQWLPLASASTWACSTLHRPKSSSWWRKTRTNVFWRATPFWRSCNTPTKTEESRRATVESTFALAYANQQVQHRRRRTDQTMPMIASFGKRILLVLFLKFLIQTICFWGAELFEEPFELWNCKQWYWSVKNGVAFSK